MYKVCVRHQGTILLLAEFEDKKKAEDFIQMPCADELDPEYTFYPYEMFIEGEN